jgi:hypothetical protein
LENAEDGDFPIGRIEEGQIFRGLYGSSLRSLREKALIRKGCKRRS